MDMNVEDDGPDPATLPDAPAAPPVEAAPEQPPAPAAEPAAAEVDAVEVGGQKYVPVAALINERKQRQALQEKAGKADQLEAYVNDSRPYVEFLRANPDLLKPRQVPAPPAPTTFGTPVDPQAEALAKTLDLYTPEGKPDIQRATVIRTMMTETAQQIANQAIGPVHERNYQDQSARNFQLALGVKDAQGRTPSREALIQIWRSMPAQQTADPQVAQILALTALGIDSVSAKPTIPAPLQPPVVTEGPGGPTRRAALSNLEASIARDRGTTQAKWQELTQGFTPGRPQQLED